MGSPGEDNLLKNMKWKWESKEEAETWLPVSTWFNWWPLVVFQKRIHLSAVPPPDARRPFWWGDHAMALTAAVCSVSFKIGCWECWFHTRSWKSIKQLVLHNQAIGHWNWYKGHAITITWLSFPPEASSLSSWDHFKPHTYNEEKGIDRLPLVILYMPVPSISKNSQFNFKVLGIQVMVAEQINYSM